MHKISNISRHFVNVGLITLLTSFTLTALGSGFQLFEYNAVNLGDFGAGGAAIANDASTAYANPAGMTRLTSQQIAISADEVISDMEFRGYNTWQSNAISVPPYTEYGSTQGGTSNLIPALFYVLPINDHWAFGFSILSPFGLESNYDNNSVLRYSATNSKVTTLDFSPSLAYKINEKISLGAGIDIIRADANLESIVGIPSLPPTPTARDSLSENSANDWSKGWHAGALYQITPLTRIGFTYFSKVTFDLKGTSKLTGPMAGSTGELESNNLQAGLTLPAFYVLSIYHDFNQQWSADSSLAYTQWSQFNRTLMLENVRSTSSLVNVTLPQKLQNSWRFAIGVNYKVTPNWLLRAGTGYDQSPVPDSDRNVRLPDGNRIGLSIGTHYQANKSVGLDFGYTHIFVQNVHVNITSETGSQYSTAVGNYKSHADLLGAQLTWNLG